MNNAPIIGHWDLNPRLLADEALRRRVLDDIVSERFLVLYLYDGSGSLSAPAIEAVRRLSYENTRVMLTVRPSDDIGAVRHYVWYIYFEVHSLKQLNENLDTIETYGISFPVREENAKDIVGIVKACGESRIRHIHFPIQRVSGKEPPYYADGNILNSISDVVDTLGRVEVTIHDPFLWRAFNPGQGAQSRGCSGAYTMVYISPELDVTPCPLVPLSMGNLRETPLREVFFSERRQEIRNMLSTIPEDCISCAESVSCAGGCRGRAYVITGGFESKDPACTASYNY